MSTQIFLELPHWYLQVTHYDQPAFKNSFTDKHKFVSAAISWNFPTKTHGNMAQLTDIVGVISLLLATEAAAALPTPSPTQHYHHRWLASNWILRKGGRLRGSHAVNGRRVVRIKFSIKLPPTPPQKKPARTNISREKGSWLQCKSYRGEGRGGGCINRLQQGWWRRSGGSVKEGWWERSLREWKNEPFSRSC